MIFNQWTPHSKADFLSWIRQISMNFYIFFSEPFNFFSNKNILSLLMDYEPPRHSQNEDKHIPFPLLDYAMSTLDSSDSAMMNQRIIFECRNILRDQINKVISYEQSLEMFMQYTKCTTPCKIVSQVLYTLEHHCPVHQPEVSQNTQRKCRMWNQEEDIILLAGIHKFGLGDWKSISAYVGNGRSRSQCSQRWGRALDPKIVKEPWSDEEDAILLTAVQELGEHAWASISKRIKTRSDVQCRYRYFQLQKKAPKSKKSDLVNKCHFQLSKQSGSSNYSGIRDSCCKSQLSSSTTPISSILTISPIKDCSDVICDCPTSDKTFVQRLLEVNLFNCPLQAMIPPLRVRTTSEPSSPIYSINTLLSTQWFDGSLFFLSLHP